MAPFTTAQVRTRRCCCCIPTRWAVMLLSLISATSAAVLGIEATIRLFEPEHPNILSIWLALAQSVLWYSLTLVCLYGWTGALMQKLVWWHLWLNTIFGLYALLMLNLPGSKMFLSAVCFNLNSMRLKISAELVDGFDNAEQTASSLGDVATTCYIQIKGFLLMLDFAVILALLIELYLVVAIGHYMDQLADYEAARDYGVDIEAAAPPYPLAMVGGAEQGLLMQEKKREGKVGKRW
ncbi:hypothetical protein JCM8547_003490 [Rhodosporidiobolus lusitaniae]